MRPRELRISLWDMANAAALIEGFVRDHTLKQYSEDPLLRSAVERQLEVLGEAASRALRAEPRLSLALPDAQNIVGLRNRIAHGYDSLDDAILWDAATKFVPALRAKLETLLAGLAE